jgi:hypothetical protein
MKQSPLLLFESTAFSVSTDEDAATNPGIFGRALAQWLHEQLSSRGFPTREVIPEDFGWCIPIESKSHALYVACSNSEQRTDRWQVFAFAEGGLMARLIRMDKRGETVAALYDVVKACLETAPEIRSVRIHDA